MTEEEVVNVRGGEISDSSDGDRHNIKVKYCNGDAAHENGSVAGDGDGAVVSGNGGGDSGASDLIVVVEDKVEGKALGESDVTVSEASPVAECECEEAVNKEEENDLEEKTEISNGTIPVGWGGQNDEGSVVVLEDNAKEVNETITCDHELAVQNGAKSEIRDGVDEVNGADANGIQQNGEIHGDEKKEPVTVVEVDRTDGNNGSHSELESVAVENCVVNKEVSVTMDVNEFADKDGESKSAEKAQLEAVDSGGGIEEGGGSVLEGTTESTSDAVSDEKAVAQEVTDREFTNVVNGDDQNGSAETEKDEIPIGIDGVHVSVDVKECAGEDAHTGSDVEKSEAEAVTDSNNVDKSVAGGDVQNGSAEQELSNGVHVEGGSGCEFEKPEEESGEELVDKVEDSSALNNSNISGHGIVVPEANANVMESEAEPSKIAMESDPEPSNLVVEREAEPSNAAVESEPEPSIIAVETEPSKIAVESEAEPEAEPSAEGVLCVEREAGNVGDEETKLTEEGSNTDAVDVQNMGSEVVKRPFYYLIRIPRYDDDENIKEQIKIAIQQVEEKTRIRDEIRSESQNKKATCKEYNQEFRAAITAERAARDTLKSKRQEMDLVQATMNRLNNAISVGDIDGKIRNMEHMIEHETLPLKEEKQLIRQIKQLKQNREELSSSMAKQDQSQKSLDDKENIEESSKKLQLLKKEIELLRSNVQKAEAATKAAKKKYEDECNILNEISTRFKFADDVRQEAYAKLQTLKKQFHLKSKYFWEYKNASKKGQDLAAEGKKEELQCFCMDQVERMMELWNKNDEFRRDYVRCNTRSTLRRLQTLDGRSLGPDEEPPVIPSFLPERVSKDNSSVSQSTLDQEKKPTPAESVNKKAESAPKAVEQKTEKSQTTKAKKAAKATPLEKSVAAIPRWADEPEDIPEEPVRTKEEEEQILKAEIARKEEEAAKLKEKRRLEEIEKAKEAMLRKQRNAEKAQQRAALKAQKEAEQKEKEREKRLRKKERRKAASTETAENTEQEPTPISETVTRSTEECVQSEKPVEVTRRSQYTRQSKAKSMPLPLRNRGKRRIQPWMWAVIAVLAVVALFFLGNNSSLRSWLQGSAY
ncbi:proton pump-interactor BIP103 isoform X2 [Arachis ipaensis]|uniref:proton pump-interactor BIP103 isoform X2 n=1 Tax=Arachis ipaensis TaxID=130454 RepID=UPI0007AEF175|nr:proton pump-interactor BIP103 isoform X2 [Arachis ipaensis]